MTSTVPTEVAAPRSRLAKLSGPMLVFVDLLLIAGLEKRSIHRPGHALILFGLVVATALLRQGRATRPEMLAYTAMAFFLAGAEVHEAKTYRLSEQTFLYCRLDPDGLAHFQRVGDARLRDVTLRVVDQYDLHAIHVRKSDDLADFAAVYQTVQLGNFSTENAKQITLPPLHEHNGLIRYRLSFTATNGYWWEDVEMHRENGHWFSTFRIRRYQGATPVTLLASVDPGFRWGQSAQDWDWANEPL